MATLSTKLMSYDKINTFFITPKYTLIVHPCNVLAPIYTGPHFYSFCISTCRVTSGQRDIRSRDIPYSSFARLNFPSFHQENSRLDLPCNLRKSGMPGSPNVTYLSVHAFLLLAGGKAWRNELPYPTAEHGIQLANRGMAILGKHSKKAVELDKLPYISSHFPIS